MTSGAEYVVKSEHDSLAAMPGESHGLTGQRKIARTQYHSATRQWKDSDRTKLWGKIEMRKATSDLIGIGVFHAYSSRAMPKAGICFYATVHTAPNPHDLPFPSHVASEAVSVSPVPTSDVTIFFPFTTPKTKSSWTSWGCTEGGKVTRSRPIF